MKFYVADQLLTRTRTRVNTRNNVQVQVLYKYKYQYSFLNCSFFVMEYKSTLLVQPEVEQMCIPLKKKKKTYDAIYLYPIAHQ